MSMVRLVYKKDKSLHGQFFQETKAEAAGVIRKEKGRSER